MPDRPRRDLTDEQFEHLLRGLPRREPRPELRERVLSHQLPPARRPHLVFRPAFGVAALALLLLADLAAMRSQDSGYSPGRAAPPAAVTAQADDDTSWLRELGFPRLRLAALPASDQPNPDSYLALRNRLLQGANGG